MNQDLYYLFINFCFIFFIEVYNRNPCLRTACHSHLMVLAQGKDLTERILKDQEFEIEKDKD